MTVRELVNKDIYKCINVGEELDKKIEKPFCCDLLSIAMGRAPKNSAWITVMGNVNTLAVASLADVACIILAEGANLDEGAIKKAKEQSITVFTSEQPIFDISLQIHGWINDSISL
ncbi:MAG: hypothetical protein K0S61_1180 [Anaerocolumna sp.]|jgi:hypothetical protein|nr:hypothetical protein [Anaerocolumna sp.]